MDEVQIMSKMSISLSKYPMHSENPEREYIWGVQMTAMTGWTKSAEMNAPIKPTAWLLHASMELDKVSRNECTN